LNSWGFRGLNTSLLLSFQFSGRCCTFLLSHYPQILFVLLKADVGGEVSCVGFFFFHFVFIMNDGMNLYIPLLLSNFFTLKWKRKKSFDKEFAGGGKGLECWSWCRNALCCSVIFQMCMIIKMWYAIVCRVNWNIFHRLGEREREIEREREREAVFQQWNN